MPETAQHTNPRLSDYWYFPDFPPWDGNGKALRGVMQHYGSPAQDSLLWWLLDCCLDKVYIRGF